jgi:mannose-6-phosphate isomerase
MRFGIKEIMIKPWGTEEWLELNEKYCFKRICINEGHQTSLQYHEQKKETIIILSGTATLVYQTSPEGGKLTKEVKSGDTFTINPSDRHRLIAKTDLVFFEASSPEVFDVVRLEDAYDRQ